MDLLIYNVKEMKNGLLVGDGEVSGDGQVFHVEAKTFQLDESFKSFQGLLLFQTLRDKFEIVCLLHNQTKRQYIVGNVLPVLQYLFSQGLLNDTRTRRRFIRHLCMHFNYEIESTQKSLGLI